MDGIQEDEIRNWGDNTDAQRLRASSTAAYPQSAPLIGARWRSGTCAHSVLNLLLQRQQQHERLTQILQSKCLTVPVLPSLLGNTGEVFRSTLSDIKLAGADADRISNLAFHSSTHAQKSMQSIIQSRRVAEAIPQHSVLSRLQII